VVEPNRLRDQVPHGGSGAALAERRPWAPRRIVGASAFGEALIVAVSTPLILTGPTAWIGIAGWLVANAALGAALALVGGGRPTWRPLFAGVTLACLASGFVAAGAAMVGAFPKQADTNAPPSVLLAGFLVAVLVFMFAAPIAMVGAVIGAVVVDARARRRHSAVARGELPLNRPTGELENRSRATKPLDDLDLAKVTADGAATTVIREYPLDASPDVLLTADKRKLAAIGYAVFSVVRRPAKSGLGWSLLSAVLFVMDLALIFSAVPSLLGGLRESTRGYEVVTFKLTSLSHNALTPEAFVAEGIDQPRAEPIAEESERDGPEPNPIAEEARRLHMAWQASTPPDPELPPTGRSIGWLYVLIAAGVILSFGSYLGLGASTDPNDPGWADITFFVSPFFATVAGLAVSIVILVVGLIRLADTTGHRARNAAVGGGCVGPIAFFVTLVVGANQFDSLLYAGHGYVVIYTIPIAFGVLFALGAALVTRRPKPSP
jgi:MFS family permease